jgi:murein DD-endopeptidase MepM/ murein hydrolase activator NlpD
MGCARLRLPLLWGAAVFLVGGLALYLRVGTVRRPPVEVGAPVAGRWEAVNSPADKVPSHGLHAYGQTYAIDLVHEPVDGSRPQFGAGPSFRPPTDYPAFGQPVLAPADGVVVQAHGRERDTAAAAPGRAFST